MSMYTITIIEDDEILSTYLESELTQVGFTVRKLAEGNAGLDDMRAHTPQLLLLDVVLPQTSGIELLREMRQDQRLKDVPVIVMSAQGSDELIKQALLLGAVDYVVKSQHPSGEIVEKARRYVSTGRV